MVIYTGNGDIKNYYLVVILLYIQQVIIQLQLLVCNTQARVGTLFRNMLLTNSVLAWFTKWIGFFEAIWGPTDSLKRNQNTTKHDITGSVVS